MTVKGSEAHSTAARARAEASFKKEERAKDGALAMMEYLAQGRVVRERMEQLKALRLAKEAAEKKKTAEKEPNTAPVAKKAAKKR